jgi:acetyltransferase-like isoleucine patch superfamily enzyme
MRKITPQQISVFLLLLGIILFSGIATTNLLLGALPLGDFRGITLILGAVVFVYLYAFAVYRLFLRFMPLTEGELPQGSRGEFAAQINILFYLILFNSLIRTHFLPVPLMRLVYLALGARLGDNTYSAGVLLDPPLTEFGANCIIGHDAVLFCHAIEGSHFSLSRIQCSDNVTIGATAVIMAGVRIGDGSIVSAGAVVLKGTQIGSHEVWGGVPAKRLR